MKNKIIVIIILILLLGGVGRSHYKIKRLETEMFNLHNEINQMKTNQTIIMERLSTKESNTL